MKVQINKSLWAIGIIWLFYVSGIIGISIGFKDWFVTKTPLNLLIGFVLLIITTPIDTSNKWILTTIFFSVGMIVEWVGVATGLPFGDYYYGENLGFKVLGVPLMIGINWAVLTIITGVIAGKLFRPIWIKAAIGAGLMVFLDLFMEGVAPQFDFWYFPGGAPFINYLAWFLIAMLLHLLFQKRFDYQTSAYAFNLYVAQLLFFAWFYLTYDL